MTKEKNLRSEIRYSLSLELDSYLIGFFEKFGISKKEILDFCNTNEMREEKYFDLRNYYIFWIQQETLKCAGCKTKTKREKLKYTGTEPEYPYCKRCIDESEFLWELTR